MDDQFSLLLIDPHLRGIRGHCFPYDLSILEQGRRRKHRVVVYGHQDMEPAVHAALDAVPLFPDVPKRSARWPVATLRRLSSFDVTVRTTGAFVRRFRDAASDGAGTPRLLFFPNCGWLGDALWVALGLLLTPVGSEARYVLLFRVEPPAERHKRAWVSLAFRIIERAARRNAVRLVTDSARLARAYRSVTSLPIEVVPIPHVPPESACGPSGEAERAQAAAPHLVYLGGGREDQGVHLLVDALIQMRQQLTDGAFSATVQLNASDVFAVESSRRLEGAGLDNVRIIRGTLPREEYERILGSADLVLIPYLAESYHFRTSGVLTEALSLGKPAVVPRDTWMSDQVSHQSGVLFDGRTPEDLARAVREALQGLDELKAGAAELRPEWNKFHSPDNFYRHLVYGSGAEPSRLGSGPEPLRPLVD